MNKKEIIEVFQMPREQYEREIMKPAFDTLLAHKEGVSAAAMLGYSNICRNQCLYCGMRAGNHLPKRYRISAEDIKKLAGTAREIGLKRLFLVSGEDPDYPFDDLLEVIKGAREMGFARISLGAGEFSREQYWELRAAGLDEYVMKFEMSHKDTFERLNPSTTFERRNQGIRWIKEAGLLLGSGNIVDFPGQSLEELADDILLMKELEISWAPNIPFMPAAGTPLAVQEDGSKSPFGSVDKMQREISLVRLLLPEADITAQQPGREIRNGLGDREGNQEAIRSGGNLLFVDMLPAALAGAFRVVDNRMLQDLAHVRRTAEEAGVPFALL